MFRRGSELLLMNAFSLLAAFIVGSFDDDSLAPCDAALGCALGYSIFWKTLGTETGSSAILQTPTLDCLAS